MPRAAPGAHIDYTTVDSDYGRVLVAATQKGIAAVFLGDNDRTLEKDLKHDFPAADIARNDRALGPRVKSVLARLYGRKPSALDAADVPLDIVGTAFQWKVWKALTEIPAGQTRTYGEIAQQHRRARGGPRRRPGLRHQPGGRASFPAIAPSAPAARSPAIAGAWRARSGCWPRNAGAAARRRRRCRRGAGAPAGRRAPGCDCRRGSASRRTPPGCGRPARGRLPGAAPLPVTIRTTRRSCVDALASRKRPTARSAAASVMPCRSSDACGCKLAARQGARDVAVEAMIIE